LEGCLGFVDKTGSEGAKAHLDKSSVEKNLAVNVERIDSLL